MWGEFVPGEVEGVSFDEVSNVNNEGVGGYPDAGDPEEQCEIVVANGHLAMSHGEACDQSFFGGQEGGAWGTQGGNRLWQYCVSLSGKFTIVVDQEVRPS